MPNTRKARTRLNKEEFLLLSRIDVLVIALKGSQYPFSSGVNRLRSLLSACDLFTEVTKQLVPTDDGQGVKLLELKLAAGVTPREAADFVREVIGKTCKLMFRPKAERDHVAQHRIRGVTPRHEPIRRDNTLARSFA